jgi:hypothetical protein
VDAQNTDLDQVHVPDPVREEILRLEQKLEQVQKELDQLRKNEHS